MHHLFKYIFVILALTCLSAASADEYKILISKEFSLGIGQTASMEGNKLVIKFKAVIEDSRCPVNVLCEWAGNGKVEFEILDLDGQNKTVILNTEDEPRTTTLAGHKLTLISLSPPRMDGVSISPADYSITLRIGKKSSE
jgi:hypothetical protein